MDSLAKQPCDQGIIEATTSTSSASSAAGPAILAATILGSSMAFIDGTVVNVALPALQKQLGATAIDVQWVVECYALFLAGLLLLGGSLGDRYGRKMVYAIGVSIFALASIACGLAADVRQLIIARSIQGIGGALLVPGSLAIIGASFDAKERGKAIGTWSGFTSITAAIGPVLGGWLIEHASWRAAFFINVPIAVIVLFLIVRSVPESRAPKTDGTYDWPGAMLATAGLGLLVFGLLQSGAAGFLNFQVAFSLITGLALLSLFLFIESRVRNPMLPLPLFRSRNFSGANLLTFFLYAALSGALFFFPLNLIQVQGYTATAAGASLLPFTLIMFSLSRWSGGLVRHYGPKLPLVAGPLLAAAGFLLFAIPKLSQNYWTSFFPAVVLLAFGMSISVAPLTTTVMNSVGASQSGIASGVNNAIARTAGLLAIALFGLLMLRDFSQKLSYNLKSIPIDRPQREELLDQKIKLAAIRIPAGFTGEQRETTKQAIRESFVGAFRLIMICSAIMAFASAISAWVLIGEDRVRK